MLDQALEAVQIREGVLVGCPVLGLLTLCLHQLHLEGPRIDLREQLALAHHLAFREVHADELAIHPALDGDGVQGGDGTEPREAYRHVTLAGLGRHDGHRASARGVRAGGLLPSPGEEDQSDDCRHSQDGPEAPATEKRRASGAGFERQDGIGGVHAGIEAFSSGWCGGARRFAPGGASALGPDHGTGVRLLASLSASEAEYMASRLPIMVRRLPLRVSCSAGERPAAMDWWRSVAKRCSS